MPVWRPTSVDTTPELVMRSWLLLRTERDEVHLCGYNVSEGEGRVSSPLIAFDRDRMVATTRSGRHYRLEGPSGADGDAFYVWQRWCAINRVTAYTDVTAELLGAGLPAVAATGKRRRPRRANPRGATA